MARKPRREEVQKLIKGLLDSELPEIQNVAKQLTDRIKQLEEHSVKLQNYVAQIESLTVEESDALVDARIRELVAGLEKALGERRQKPGAAVSETKAEPKVEESTEVKEDVEADTGVVSGVDEGVDEVSSVKLKKYSTPEGLVIRKTRL